MLDRATASVRFLSGEREPVRVATTANIALDGLQTIDGIALAVNDRVLVKNQTDARTNGIYTASEGLWYRASDARFSRAISEGVTVQVIDGTVHGGQSWRFATYQPNIGTDGIEIAFYLSANFSEDVAGTVAQAIEDVNGAGAVIVAAAEAARDQALGAVPNVFVASLSALKALDTTTITQAWMTAVGLEGQFVWRTGDYSAEVASDPRGGVYVKADAVATTAGAWVRALDENGVLFAGNYGLSTTETATANSTALGAFLAAWKADENTQGKIGAGVFEINGAVDFDNPLGVLSGTGNSVLKYTGALVDPAFSLAPAAVAVPMGLTLRNMTLQGNANVPTLLMIDNITHASFEDISLKDCNPTGAALKTKFMVLNTFKNLEISNNRDPFTIGAKPYTGMDLGEGTGSADQTIACTWYDTIVEGTGSTGIVLTNGWYNSFHGGTSEGNGGFGVYIGVNSHYNIFTNFFCEVNTAGDWLVEGDGNQLINCEGVASPNGLQISGNRNIVYGGRYDTLEIQSGAIGNILVGVGIKNGSYTDAGTGTVMIGCYNYTTGGSLSGAVAFTPAFGGTTSDGTITYVSQAGSYQIINGRCFFDLTIQVNAVSVAPVGGLVIRGLPAPSTASSAVNIGLVLTATLPASTTQFAGYIPAVDDEIRLYGLGTGTATVLDAASVSGLWVVSGSYPV